MSSYVALCVTLLALPRPCSKVGGGSPAPSSGMSLIYFRSSFQMHVAFEEVLE